jgi:ribose/xylose/arabinose/galactoside ABC-type transport system permease subunit
MTGPVIASGPPTTTPRLAADTAPPRRRRAALYDDLALLLLLAVLYAFFAVKADGFSTWANIQNLLLGVSVIGTMAAVSTLVVISGMLDLSVGSAAAYAAVFTAWLNSDVHLPTAAAILLGLLLGLVIGLINGWITEALHVPAIITTIGMLSVLRGLAYLFANGTEILVSNHFLVSLGVDSAFGLPWSVWIMLVVFAVVAVVANWTIAGRNVFAIGANSRASLLAGLPVSRYRIALLAASGLSAALAGIVLAAQAGTANSTAANGYELQVITAVLLGGASLTGGAGKVRGTLLAILIIGVLNNGMTILAIQSYWQTVASGALLIVAVAVDQGRARLRRRRAAA